MPCLVFPPRTLKPEGVLHRASLTVFLSAGKMSYYGGAELPEPPETASGVNYMYDSDGRNLGSIL